MILSCLILISLMASPMASAMTAEEIIQKRDSNEYVKTAIAQSKMVIVSGNREMTKTMTTYVEDNNGLTIFTNPRDRGTKFLKRGDDLWMFFPDAEDLIKISGHMLSQGMMGSDFSYQDVMESDKLTDLYTFELLGEEELDGRPCYILEGVAVEGKQVSYYRRKSWVDKERFVGLRKNYMPGVVVLLKVMSTKKVELLEERVSGSGDGGQVAQEYKNRVLR